MSAIPTITMHQVESSQFAAIGHVPEVNLLAIQFHPKKNGQSDIYHYQNVSAEMFAEFLGAESQGSFFIQRIKKDPAQFPYTKADQAAFSYSASGAALKPAAMTVPVAAPTLTKELLAVALHGREYPFDLTDEEQAQAKAAGLVVIFGAGDDSFEVRGAFTGQQYVYDSNDRVVQIDATGLLSDAGNLDNYVLREPLANTIKPIFSNERPAWTYSTTIPHATFEIMEDGDVYCRGIVISVADLGGAA